MSINEIALSDRIDSARKKYVLAQEYQISMTYELGKEIDKMCNLSDAIEERGIKQGIEINAIENTRKLFENGVSFSVVRACIEALSDEKLQQIYDEVINQK